MENPISLYEIFLKDQTFSLNSFNSITFIKMRRSKGNCELTLQIT